MTTSDSETPGANKEPIEECFVIMPISDYEPYSPGHFLRVYEDIITPACRLAGFRAIRGDDVKQTNLIHLDILQKLIHTPMALCDLSSSNPNVMFELALRQAFDKPVVLIQEVGSKQIFDISPLRYTEYRKARIYHEVLEDQKKIAGAIRDTSSAFKKDLGINSIVKLLALTEPAKVPQKSQETKEGDMLRILLEEVGQLRSEISRSRSTELPEWARRDIQEPALPLRRPRATSIVDLRKAISLFDYLIDYPSLGASPEELDEFNKRLEKLEALSFKDGILNQVFAERIAEVRRSLKAGEQRLF
jgi:hypothetical protein